MTELIKYTVAATVSKSAEHAEGGSRAPPMLEWHREELLEWLRAFHGFRRTRTYAALYKLEEPPREVEQILWLGSVGLRRGRYWLRVPLLDSIPEDKSAGGDPRRRLEAILRSLAPGGIPGAGRLGSYVQSQVWSVG